MDSITMGLISHSAGGGINKTQYFAPNSPISIQTDHYDGEKYVENYQCNVHIYPYTFPAFASFPIVAYNAYDQ